MVLRWTYPQYRRDLVSAFWAATALAIVLGTLLHRSSLEELALALGFLAASFVVGFVLIAGLLTLVLLHLPFPLVGRVICAALFYVASFSAFWGLVELIFHAVPAEPGVHQYTVAPFLFGVSWGAAAAWRRLRRGIKRERLDYKAVA